MGAEKKRNGDEIELEELIMVGVSFRKIELN